MQYLIHLFIAFVPSLAQLWLFARGGGGGSGGGGGGGGGGGFSGGGYYGGSGGSGSGGPAPWWTPILFLVIFFGIFGYAIWNGIRQAKSAQNRRPVMGKSNDPLVSRIEEVFLGFQQTWSSFDLETMSQYVGQSYMARVKLELGALEALGRQNVVAHPKIYGIAVTQQPSGATDGATFKATITAAAKDQLVVHATGDRLYTDDSQFTEYWTFVHEAGAWKLQLIEQSTQEPSRLVTAIQAFATEHGFFYDGDFGWLLMPDRGVLFGKSNFETSDINNHVIGAYQNKTIELYTFVPRTGDTLASQWTVGQTTLPVSYHNILIKRRHGIQPTPKGLREIRLESNDFNKRFRLWADPADSISSLELLNPQFMERIYALPFELNIEIVGQYLYFYTADKNARYEDIFQVLAWAFDELKR